MSFAFGSIAFGAERALVFGASFFPICPSSPLCFSAASPGLVLLLGLALRALRLRLDLGRLDDELRHPRGVLEEVVGEDVGVVREVVRGDDEAGLQEEQDQEQVQELVVDPLPERRAP